MNEAVSILLPPTRVAQINVSRKEGLVMFNKFTTAGISHPAQGSAEFDGSVITS